MHRRDRRRTWRRTLRRRVWPDVDSSHPCRSPALPSRRDGKHECSCDRRDEPPRGVRNKMHFLGAEDPVTGLANRGRRLVVERCPRDHRTAILASYPDRRIATRGRPPCRLASEAGRMGGAGSVRWLRSNCERFATTGWCRASTPQRPTKGAGRQRDGTRRLEGHHAARAQRVHLLGRGCETSIHARTSRPPDG